mmetsp:Transcript_61407/g.190349  ORF Transcript_61407/g.190349 Transcript_61407/m.190349 type:complete len:138 (-) Transcript_61407:940-1353(-)
MQRPPRHSTPGDCGQGPSHKWQVFLVSVAQPDEEQAPSIAQKPGLHLHAPSMQVVAPCQSLHDHQAQVPPVSVRHVVVVVVVVTTPQAEATLSASGGRLGQVQVPPRQRRPQQQSRDSRGSSPCAEGSLATSQVPWL